MLVGTNVSSATLQIVDSTKAMLFLTKMVRYEILPGKLLDIDGKLTVFRNVLRVWLSRRCVFPSSEHG